MWLKAWRMSLTLPSLYLRHNSFSNPSVASPTSQLIHQPFFRLSYVTGFSLTSPGEPPMPVGWFKNWMREILSWTGAWTRVSSFTSWCSNHWVSKYNYYRSKTEFISHSYPFCPQDRQFVPHYILIEAMRFQSLEWLFMKGFIIFKNLFTIGHSRVCECFVSIRT